MQSSSTSARRVSPPQPHELPPLHGFTVTDFSQRIAGPLASRFLTDLGCSCTHVDPPTGPTWQSPANSVLHRGKEMIQIDLASVAGQAAARELVRRSDVVVEPPFATAEVRSLNPRAICLTLPAFCPDDEHFADVEAAAGDFEACLLASMGVFQDMGLNRTLMGQRVSYSPLPLASAYSSVLAAYSVVMALLSLTNYSGSLSLNGGGAEKRPTQLTVILLNYSYCTVSNH